MTSPDGLLTSYPVVSGATVAATLAVCVVSLSVSRGAPAAARKRGPIERLLVLALVATLAISAATALGSVWTEGAMHGWPLLIHVAIGGALTGVLAAFGVLGAISQHTTPTRPLARMTFLALVISGFLTATSMLVCTFPILGTSWMERMADLHRYAGLGLVASASLHLVAARTA